MSNLAKTKIYHMLVFVTILLLTSCHTYYKATQVQKNNPSGEAATIDSLRLSKRYFILRSGSESFYMKNPTVGADQKSLNCILDKVSHYHQPCLSNDQSGKMKYNNNNPMESSVLNEVHFYLPPDSSQVSGPYKVQLIQIQKIEVIEKDKKRTANSYVIGGICYAIGVIFLFWIIGSVVFVSIMSAL